MSKFLSKHSKGEKIFEIYCGSCKARFYLLSQGKCRKEDMHCMRCKTPTRKVKTL